MIRRGFWFAAGLGMGAGLSIQISRWARETVERYAPRRLTDSAAGSIRRLQDDARAALAEGRATMQRREAELKGASGAHR